MIKRHQNSLLKKLPGHLKFFALNSIGVGTFYVNNMSKLHSCLQDIKYEF